MAFVLNTTTTWFTTVSLDGINVLGQAPSNAGHPDAVGPYMDGYFTPKQDDYVPINPNYTVVTGTDSTGSKYGGIILTQYAPENQTGMKPLIVIFRSC